MCYNGSLSFHTLWPCSLGWLFLCLLVQSPSIIDWLKQQPTPVFLAGKSHGRRSLVGYTVHGIAESDTTERLHSLTPVRHFEWSINKIFAKPENGHSQHHGIKRSWNIVMATAMALKGPWKEFRVKIINEALCALGKTGRTGLQIVRSFQEKILWVPILASSYT